MISHFIGKQQPEETPAGDGVSLAVLQWMELVRGQRPVRRPANEFRIVEMVAEERYCFHCFGDRWFDVVLGEGSEIPMMAIKLDVPGRFRLKRCRSCGKESGA